jgi:hypothetical protein
MATTRPHEVVHQAKFLQINPPKNENAKEDRYNQQFDGVHREDGEDSPRAAALALTM